MTVERSAQSDSELHGIEFRLSWGGCDPAGIIYYATYLEWAERAHSEWWYLRGLRIDAMADRIGASFVVRHVSCGYHRSPTVMDVLRCSLALELLGGTSFTIVCTFVLVATGEVQAVLHLTAVFVDAARRPVAVPDGARPELTKGASRPPGVAGPGPSTDARVPPSVRR